MTQNELIGTYRDLEVLRRKPHIIRLYEVDGYGDRVGSCRFKGCTKPVVALTESGGGTLQYWCRLHNPAPTYWQFRRRS